MHQKLTQARRVISLKADPEKKNRATQSEARNSKQKQHMDQGITFERNALNLANIIGSMRSLRTILAMINPTHLANIFEKA